MQPSWRQVGAAHAVVGGGLVLGHALAPPGIGAEVLYLLVSCLVLAAVLVGVRRHQPRIQGPWRRLELGLWFTVAASAAWVVFLAVGLPTAPLGLIYLAAWVACVSAAWSLTRVRTPRRERGTALDVAIVTTGAGIILYVFVVQPTWAGLEGSSGLERGIAMLYPLFGLALVAVLSRLVFGGAARVAAFWYLATAVLLLLFSDLVHAVAMLRGLPSGGPATLRLLGFVCMGAAALHPTMARLTDEVDEGWFRLSRPRLLALWSASVAAPATLLVRAGFGNGSELPVIAIGSVALFTLVVARMWGLLATHASLLRRQHENRFRALVEHAEDVIALLGDDDQIVYVSTSVERTFGFPTEVVLERGKLRLPPETAERLHRAIADLRREANGRPVRLSGRVMHADGGWRNVDAVLVDRRDDPAIGRVVLTIRDVTAQWELEQQLTHQAFHDTLTELPNRALFVDRARQALGTRRTDGSLCAVLFLDLDDFKTVNDSLGHDQGDELLRVVSRRLADVVRGEDTVARLGGDEFAVLVPRVDSPSAVTALAERVLAAVAEPLELAGRTILPNASLGIAVAAGVVAVDELLRDADAAMYVAKRQGKGTFRLFDPGMHARAMHRLQLRTDLLGAIDREELFVVYHPIHDLDRGTVAGVEALLRWHHPTLGLVPPAEFIPIAEESGRIADLGGYVLRRACADVQALRAGGQPELFLTVNVSPLQLEDPHFVDEVVSALADSGLPADALVLELTERMLLEECEAVTDSLARMRSIGIRLAIDDFGTGYCSLAYLTRLPVDVIKVDQSFVALLDDAHADHRVTVGILELIASLDAPAVAEGIETPRQLDHLRTMGCRYGQGFLWGEPVPVDALTLPAAVTA